MSELRGTAELRVTSDIIQNGGCSVTFLYDLEFLEHISTI